MPIRDAAGHRRPVRILLVSLVGLAILVASSFLAASLLRRDGWAGPVPVAAAFGDTEGENHYNYCPSYLEIDENTRYMFYCRNPVSDIISDSIFWRRADRINGEWVWSEQQEALWPGEGWDSEHVCDPEVRAGSFRVNGHEYGWAMFFLGCDQKDYNHNQVGVAFSDSVEGPWHKWAGNPLVPYSGRRFWGVGQPSATALDENGRLVLYYTRCDATGWMTQYRILDLSDMDHPDLGVETTLPVDGLTEKDGSGVILNNAGFALDSATNRLFAIRERHPNEHVDATIIPTELQVAHIDAVVLSGGEGTWTVTGQVTPIRTGYPRNHNAGFLTDPLGRLVGGPNDFEMAISIARTGPWNLWTYRLAIVGATILHGENRLDDRSQAVRFKGIWSNADAEDYFLGTARRTDKPGASLRIAFVGTGVQVYGDRGPEGGWGRLRIDGEPVLDFNTRSNESARSVMQAEVRNLPEGPHEAMVEWQEGPDPGKDSGELVVDYLRVLDESAGG